MIAYKTSGDWGDVTSFGRNEIVFEGRNKEYGAYLVRQRYNGTLFLAMIIAAFSGVVAVALPMVINYFSKTTVISKPATRDVVIHITDYRPKDRKVTIPKPVLPPRAPASTTRVTPIRVVHTEVIDVINTNTKDDKSNVGTTNTTDTKNHDDGLNLIDNGGNTIVEENPDKDKIFISVEMMPVFPGGTVLEYLQKSTQYPEEYVEAGISGTVNYTFVVETDGSVSNIVIQRGVAGGPLLSEEVIKAIKAMPKWKPGMQNGHPVRVQYSGKISFLLRG